MNRSRNGCGARRLVSLQGTTALLVFLIPYLLTGVSQPVQSGLQPIDDFQSLLNIKFRTDVRIFAVMAAINAAGFDFEQSGLEYSTTRSELRHRLSNANPELRRKLRDFYEAHLPSQSQRDRQAAYISLALHLGPPPDFNLALDDRTPRDVRALAGFELLLRDFFAASDLNQLWNDFRPAYERELTPYRELIREIARETLSYFRIPYRVVLDREIVISPDLLNANHIVNARNRENAYYIVVGPVDSADRNFAEVQHEYLHSLVDPLVEKHGGKLLAKRALLEIAANQPNFRPAFRNNYLLVVSESLITSIQLRLRPPADARPALAQLYSEGLVMAPLFHRELETFEQDGVMTLPVYLEGLFEKIQDDKIEADGLALTHWRDEQQRTLTEQLQQEAQGEQVRALFNRGVGHLVKQEIDLAETAFRELLQINPQFEKALFNLGEILTQRAQEDPANSHLHEEAQSFYLRISQLPAPDPGTLARTLLRLGRYAASREDFAAARTRFNQVLELDGNLGDSVAEARELIKRLPPN